MALVVDGDVRVGSEAPLWAYVTPFVGMAGLVARRPVGERLLRGYQNVLMSPILVKERGRPSACSAGCLALVGWLD